MPALNFRKPIVALTLSWIGAIAFAAYLLFSAEIDRHEHTFEENTHRLSAELSNKLDTNEAVLAGFAAFLSAVERNDTVSATRYAATASAPYSHIYMLEVARKVPVSQETSFQATLRKDWLPNFTLKDFPGAMQKEAATSQTRQVTWPILFMYPSLPEAQEIYGVRLETVDFLGHSLALAHNNAKPVVSPVFKLLEGGEAYILLQEVDRSAQGNLPSEPSIFGNTMTAMLLIKSGSLIPSNNDVELPPTFEFSAVMESAAKAENQLFSRKAAPSGKLESMLLPSFARQLQIGNASQQTTMRFKQQLQWQDVLNAKMVIVLLLLACALGTFPALSLRHLKALEHGAREHERSAYLATHDILTGLPNRFLFVDRFEQAVQQHIRNGNAFALLLVDLDHFKEINDTYGHEVGDEVLVECAKRMTREIRACDTVARHGGDEFIILLANTLNIDDALMVGNKLLQAISRPIQAACGFLTITCSIGVAMYPADAETIDGLRRTADFAMYDAKKKGRNSVSARA